MNHSERSTESAIETILSQKKELVRLFLIAAILGFGVGALASLFSAQSLPAWFIIATCGFLIALSLLLLLQDLLLTLTFEDEAQAVVFIDRPANTLVSVEDYEFSESLFKTVRAVRAESKALHADWDNDPLIPRSDKPKPKATSKSKDTQYVSIVKVTLNREETPLPRSVRLLEEAAQFVLLEELSLHLSSYFNDRSDDKFVREMGRDDIPEFLLKNRVLNLLCTPIEQRDIFLKAFPDAEKRPKGEIYSVYGSDGAVFSRFDLVLPNGSSVRASSEGGIVVETKRLSFSMKATYTGTSAVVGRPFEEHYMRVPFERVATQRMVISLSGRVNAISLLTSSGWQYYRWLDSFRKRLQEKCDFETFQASIHWRLAETLLYALRKKTAKSRDSSRDPEDSVRGKTDAQQAVQADVPASGGSAA